MAPNLYLLSLNQNMMQQMSAWPEINISYHSTKTYVVDTQKKRLNEMILLSIQTYHDG